MDYFKKHQTCDKLLTDFINVLRINMAFVDERGQYIVPPDKSKFGGRFYVDSTLGGDIVKDNFLKEFQKTGHFFERLLPCDLHVFAVPIRCSHLPETLYLVVGPVILNKRLEPEQYKAIGEDMGVKSDELLNEINELRVVSNIMMISILDLLGETIHDRIHFTQMAQERNRRWQQFLDAVLALTDVECGSLMIRDQREREHLVIKAAKTSGNKTLCDHRVRIGEGVAGWVAETKEPLHIDTRQPTNSRIAHLLKRPEIKQSYVLPITDQETGELFGVLSLHTTKEREVLTPFDATQVCRISERLLPVFK